MLCFSRDFGMWGGVGMWIYFGDGSLKGWNEGGSVKSVDLLGDLKRRGLIVKYLSMFGEGGK